MIDQPEASWRLATPIHAGPRHRDASPPGSPGQGPGQSPGQGPVLRFPVEPQPEAVPAKVPADAAPDTAATTTGTPEGWLSLPDCTLHSPDGPGVVVPMVLLHPEFGIALLGVPEAESAAAETALRLRLDAARFVAIFPGHLPVVTLAMLPGEPLNLQRRLAAAFAALPPLDLAGGDGWVAVVRRALLARPPVRVLRPGPEAANLPRLKRPRPAGPNWIWPLAGLTGTAMLLGLVLGLNHPAPSPNAGPNSDAGAEVPATPSSSAPPRATAPAAPPPQAAPAPAPLPAAPAAPAPATPRPSVAVAPPAPAPSLPRVLVRSAANLRSGPDSRAPILRTAPRGEAFRVHAEARGGWVQVGDAAPEGWIHSSLLSEP